MKAKGKIELYSFIITLFTAVFAVPFVLVISDWFAYMIWEKGVSLLLSILGVVGILVCWQMIKINLSYLR